MSEKLEPGKMVYLIRYRNKHDGKRHSFSAESYEDLLRVLIDAIFLAENVNNIFIQSATTKTPIK